jgi:hypothetical protein
MLEEHLNKLCDLMEEELERQENVLAITLAQGKAARAHDIEYLEAKTAALTCVLEEGVRAESERLAVLRTVVDAFGLREEEQTLSGLISATPSPWSQRLAHFQVRMQEVLAQTRQAVRDNNRIMRGSLRVIHSTMAVLAHHLHLDPGGYTAQGGERPKSSRVPNLIDQKG